MFKVRLYLHIMYLANKRFFLPAILLCIFFVSYNACKLPDKKAESVTDSDYLVTIDRLDIKGTKYLNDGNDSVQQVAHQLITLGKRYKDTAIIIKGKLMRVNAAWKSSNYKEAMTLALNALADAQQAAMYDQVSAIYAIMGNLYKENENYLSAIPMAEKALASAKVNNDTPQMIRSILNLGMFTHSYGMQKNDTALQHEALPLYMQGLRLAESTPEFERNRIAFYDNLSQYYKMTGDDEKGIFYGNKGVELAKKYAQWSSLTYSYNWLGEIYFYQGKHQKGLAYLDKALQIAINIHNAYREMEINDAIHTCYHTIGDDKNALKYFSRSMQIRDSLQVEQNVKEIGQLHIQYETGKKDAEIASLDAISKERGRRNWYILTGLLIFLGLSVFLFFQWRGIRCRNRMLLTKNETIQEQSEQLKLLMKELHHRVKNNLQIVSSLLTLQSNHLLDHDAQQAVRIGQQRIEAMSLIHRSLYQQDAPNMVNMQEYVSALVKSLLQSFGMEEKHLDLSLEVDIKELDVDVALPLGLIINEWVTNDFKYAYDNVAHPALSVVLKRGKDIALEIRDNGPGMSREVWEKPKGSFGIKLIKVLCKQLGGKCEMDNSRGTRLTLHVPVKWKKAG